jgi:hypothetical protein
MEGICVHLGKPLRIALVLSPRLKGLFQQCARLSRRSIVLRGVFLVLAVLFGSFVVKSVRKADSVLIRQQREQLEREHQSGRHQQEETRAAQSAAATAEKQARLKAIEEEQLAWNRTYSDPPPPVSTDAIKGQWWFSEPTPNKTYLYIENVSSGMVYASLPGGRAMSLRCAVMHSTDSSSYVDDSPACTGLSNSYHAWVRVSMGSTFKAGSSAPVAGWSLLWHNGDMVESYRIQSFCDPRCILLSDKAQESPDQKTSDKENQHR